MNDFEQYLIQLQLNLTLLLVNCSCELGLTMISYDFLAVRRVILNHVRTESNLT